MQISKWGNSLAIRLPMALVKDMNLAEGDEVHLKVSGVRELDLLKKPGKDAILAALREFEGRLPANIGFDRDTANDR